jgi:hypothetical protein
MFGPPLAGGSTASSVSAVAASNTLVFTVTVTLPLAYCHRTVKPTCTPLTVTCGGGPGSRTMRRRS